MKETKGITIIAVVVTVLVLLILASVTMAMLTGPSGLFTAARESKRQNEFAIVKDTIMLKAQENAFIPNTDGKPNMISMLLNEDYVDYDYKVNMEKMNNESLELGYGNLSTGDYYSLKGEKLTYIDKDMKETEIVKLAGIGEIPVDLYFQAKTDVDTVEMNLNNNVLQSTANLILSNYDSDLITRENISYEISLKNKDTSIFNVKLGNTDLNNAKYLGTIEGKEKRDENIKVDIELKDGEIFSSESIIFNIDITEPVEYSYAVELKLTNKNILDSSGNGNHAVLENGAQVVQDENGEKAIKFNGTNYISLKEIGSDFDFSDGFKIETTIEVEGFTGNGTILTLGNGVNSNNEGQDHILLQVVQNEIGYTNCIKFETQGKGPFGNRENHTNLSESNSIKLNEKTNVSVDLGVSATYYRSVININGVEYSKSAVSSLIRPIQNTARTQNYIGKSYWNQGDFFNGKIYSLKMMDSNGTTVFEYNLN